MALQLSIIETERLLLRGIDEQDSELIVKWRSVPEIYKYFKAPHEITLEEHLNWYYNNYLANNNRYDWICIKKKDEVRIGVFGLLREKEEVEISYLLSSDEQHKGYATEAVKALINYSLNRWNCKQVKAEIHMNNKPSIDFIIKLGFVLVSSNEPFLIFGLKEKNIDLH